jgi:probable rRNA maturation factor
MRVPRKLIADLVAFVARREGTRAAEVDVAVVARGEITSLNRRWLGHARPTDVVSFDLSEGGGRGLSAQIVVCGDVAVREGRSRGTGARRELLLYVVHGLLHLMGHEDSTVRGGARMHAREEELLREFLARPAFARRRRVFAASPLRK